MKRILFVDDEPRILRGLERTLHPMREAWDMVFAESAAQALARMEHSRFDVVVTDMRMPGMTGADLLRRVMDLHPETVRIILSGHADASHVLQCSGVAHQFLSKPCDRDRLEATIRRATALEKILRCETLRHRLSRLESLPSLPKLYSELMERVDSTDASLEDIAAIIARDLGMTAKILKLVNSAFFGFARSITEPVEAVSHLGLDAVRSLVLSLETFTRFQGTPLAGLSLDDLWSHSLRAAHAARAIARSAGADSSVVDAAFTSGLLHDVGKLVLAANFPAEYAEVLRISRESAQPLRLVEHSRLGASHAAIGGFLLGLWGLPAVVVEAVATHHQPSPDGRPAYIVPIAVHVANAAVKAPESAGESRTMDLDRDALEGAGLLSRLPEWFALARTVPASRNPP